MLLFVRRGRILCTYDKFGTIIERGKEDIPTKSHTRRPQYMVLRWHKKKLKERRRDPCLPQFEHHFRILIIDLGGNLCWALAAGDAIDSVQCWDVGKRIRHQLLQPNLCDGSTCVLPWESLGKPVEPEVVEDPHVQQPKSREAREAVRVEATVPCRAQLSHAVTSCGKSAASRRLRE